MTLTRYLIITKPFTKFNFSIGRTTIYISIFWFVSIFLCVPHFLTRFDDDPSCSQMNMLKKPIFTLYILIAVVVGLCVPFVFMCVTYILTIRHLYKKRDETSQARVRHRNHVVVVLGSLISSFVICWFPVSVIWILSVFQMFEESDEGKIMETRYFKITYAISLLAGILNIVFNGAIGLYRRRNKCCRQRTEKN